MIVGTVKKQPAETYKRGMDFQERLQVGETIATPTVSSRHKVTGADTTSAIISSAAINGTIVDWRFSAGVTGDDHIVQVRAATSLSNVYEDELELQVREVS